MVGEAAGGRCGWGGGGGALLGGRKGEGPRTVLHVSSRCRWQNGTSQLGSANAERKDRHSIGRAAVAGRR